MIKIENMEIYGWEAAVRGMRNPMNSWHLSDSDFESVQTTFYEDSSFLLDIGEKDLKLMKVLAKSGDDDGKYLRMINVTMDITAPLYWWKEYDTYKVGTVANSCSTMHKIHSKEFTLDDFSHEHLSDDALDLLETVVDYLNQARDVYLNYDEYRGRITPEISSKKDVWWHMIQLLPSSYNQKRTVQLNYQVLKHMYFARKQHKLDEWREFCSLCEKLPYFKELVVENK